MSHQLLGLREYEPKKITHTFFDRKWVVPSLQELLKDPEFFVKDIPEEDRWNIYVTNHHCKNEIARDWDNQDVISFDIDDIDETRAELTAQFVCTIIGVDYNKTGIVMSGHGLQLHIMIENPITDTKFFGDMRNVYKLIIQKLNNAFSSNGVRGKADPSVFSAIRLMRCPGTWNRKPKKGPDVLSYVIQKNMELQGFTLESACGVPLIDKGEYIHDNAFKKFPVPDADAVLAECLFLTWCNTHQGEVTESQWYAMLSIVARLPNGRAIAHSMSSKYPGYNETDTNYKIDQALATAGPRKCSNINQHWSKCSGCVHWGKIQSPITIQGVDYIATEGTGFYMIKDTPQGEKIYPAYEDLIKYYVKKNGGFVSNEARIPYLYNKNTNTWSMTSEHELKSFAYNTMKPKPRSNIVNEFANTMLTTKVVRTNIIMDSSQRKLNLLNGVFNLETMQMEDKKREHYFMSSLPYNYDEHAGAPLFEKYMSDVTCNDSELQKLLLEYMGYAISGDEYKIHKMLILFGVGRNGKSTFNKMLKFLVGKDSYSSLNVEALQSDQKRAMLEGKLFNIADENSDSGFYNADIIKSLSAGEETDVKHVYSRPYSFKNRAKLIFNCNKMPKSKDDTEGMLSRLLYVPFNAVFDQANPSTDINIEDKLKLELPGILNLCIQGYLRLIRNGKFSESKASSELLAEYRTEVRDVDSWFESYVTEGTGEDFFSVNDAYDSYYKRAERLHNKYPQNRQNFSFLLRSLCEKNGYIKRQKRIGVEKPWCFFGAKLVVGHTESSF